MKLPLLAVIITVYFFAINSTVYATPGRSEDNVPGLECTRQSPERNPHCQTVTASPIGTPYASPTASSSATPNPSPSESADPTPTETSTPKGTSEPSATPQETVRTDLTDGRSDGHTESLDCLNRDCSPRKGAVLGATLPVTGNDDLYKNLFIGSCGIILGFLIRRWTEGKNV